MTVTVGIKWKSLNTYYEHYNYVRYAQEKCVEKRGNASLTPAFPISPQAAAPAALWAVPSVPRAASAKGPRTSAAVVPDVG